jgi:hypothetical protein
MKNNSSFQYLKNNVTRTENGNYYYLYDQSTFNKITINNIVDHLKSDAYICYVELNDRSSCNCKKSNVQYTVHDSIGVKIPLVYNSLNHQSNRQIDLDGVTYENKTPRTIFERIQRNESVYSYRLNNCQVKTIGVYNKSTNYDQSQSIGKINSNSLLFSSTERALEEHFNQKYLHDDSRYETTSYYTSYDVKNIGTNALQYIDQREKSQFSTIQTGTIFSNDSELNRVNLLNDESKSSIIMTSSKDQGPSRNVFLSNGNNTQSTTTYSESSINNLQFLSKNKESHRLRINNCQLNKLHCSGPFKTAIFGSVFENTEETPITFIDGVEANLSSSNIFSQNHSAIQIHSSPSINVQTSFINILKNQELPIDMISLEKNSKISIVSSKLINESFGSILNMKDSDCQAEFSNLSLKHRNEFVVKGQTGSELISDPVSIDKDVSNRIQNTVKLSKNQVSVQ